MGIFCRATGQRNRKTGAWIKKPTCVKNYVSKMGGVDTADQLMVYYTFMRRTYKWWRKVVVHILQMMIHNAACLYKKYGCRVQLPGKRRGKPRMLDNNEFREYIAHWLVTQAVKEGFVPDVVSNENQDDLETPSRLVGRHFLVEIEPTTNGDGRKTCKVCYVGGEHNKPQKRKMTRFKCKQCNRAMCVVPCFEEYHTQAETT